MSGSSRRAPSRRLPSASTKAQPKVARPDAASVPASPAGSRAASPAGSPAAHSTSSTPISPRDGPDRVPAWGSAPASVRAARRRPSSSPPTTASHRLPPVVSVAAAPSPGPGSGAPNAAHVSPASAKARRPIASRVRGSSSRPGPRARGRSSAMVSKPKRAAISAAATRSAPEGSAGSRKATPSRSGTPSSFSSSRRPPWPPPGATTNSDAKSKSATCAS